MKGKENIILSRICRISTHPVSLLTAAHRVSYLRGLGAVLYTISGGNPVMSFFYDEWCISVCGQKMPDAFKTDEKAIRKALSLKRNGWHFFRMQYEFFFDSFYLTEGYADATGENLLETLYAILKEKIVTAFTKDALEVVNEYFKHDSPSSKIPEVLQSHRNYNRSFIQKPLKKVLVVANVSAGKSTLINALAGYRLNKAKTTACTNRLSYLFNKPQPDGISVYADDKTLVYDEQVESMRGKDWQYAGLHFNSFLSLSNVCLIDTPGVNNSENLQHGNLTMQTVEKGDYDVVIYVANCQYMGTTDEKRLVRFLIEKGRKPIIYVVNQLDRFKPSEDSISETLSRFSKDLMEWGDCSPTVIPTSAHTGLLDKLGYEYLDDDEKYEFELLKKKFSKDFFDLSSYKDESSYSLLDKTGITLLEKTIYKYIQQ